MSLKVLAWPAYENKTGNPYTRLLYEAMERTTDVTVEGVTLPRALAGQYDVWHVHWPDDFLSYSSFTKAAVYVAAELILFAWARIRGARLVWTVHDLGPHESHHPSLETVFWRLFVPMVDGIISLSEAARTQATDRFPLLRRVPSAVVPHGHYRSAYPSPVSRPEGRRAYGIPPDARVVTFVGRIRPYKNVTSLIRAFREWDAQESRLLVAGSPASKEVETQIRAETESDSRVRLALRYLEEAEIAGALSASDVVVLPYESIMHSGSALLALSFDRPVVVPDRGAMSELRDEVGSEWVRTYAGDLTVDVLAEAMEWAQTASRSERAPLNDLEWAPLAAQTVDLYHRVVEAHD